MNKSCKNKNKNRNRNKNMYLAFLFASAIFASGVSAQPETFTDARDGQKYRKVKIGKQVWMAENLNYKADGSRCYGDDDSNCKKYGRLYDWAAASKACPAGWHLPSQEEWKTLESTVQAGVYYTSGKKLRAKGGWVENRNGTDNFGFSALPGGVRYYADGECHKAGEEGYWWTAYESTDNAGNAYGLTLEGDMRWTVYNKKFGFSARCVSD